MGIQPPLVLPKILPPWFHIVLSDTCHALTDFVCMCEQNNTPSSTTSQWRDLGFHCTHYPVAHSFVGGE